MSNKIRHTGQKMPHLPWILPRYPIDYSYLSPDKPEPKSVRPVREITNYKIQITNKIQTTNYKLQTKKCPSDKF